MFIYCLIKDNVLKNKSFKTPGLGRKRQNKYWRETYLTLFVHIYFVPIQTKLPVMALVKTDFLTYTF